MKRPLIALLTTILFTLSAQFAYAQPERGMDMNPEQQIKEMIAQLDISTEQEPAFREAMAKVNALRMESMGGMREGQGQGQGQGQGASHDGHNGAGDQASSTPRQDGQGREMMMQRRAQMQEKTQALLAPVLSSAQMEKFKELEAARMEQMMSRMRR